MYKVFINEKPVTLAVQAKDSDLQHGVLMARTTCVQVLECIVHAFIERPQVKGLVLLNEDLDELFANFRSLFQPINAAGGIVRDRNNRILFIFRNGKWDLPKGKVEKGESIEQAAVREVEEECGVHGLRIIGQAVRTFHIFNRKDRWFFKTTYWFEMSYIGTEELVPQQEEGIERAEWIEASDLNKVRADTWRNILELIADIE